MVLLLVVESMEDLSLLPAGGFRKSTLWSIQAGETGVKRITERRCSLLKFSKNTKVGAPVHGVQSAGVSVCSTASAPSSETRKSTQARSRGVMWRVPCMTSCTGSGSGS